MYYTERSGNNPVAEWLDNLNINARAIIMDKIAQLEEHGLLLLQTNMMKRIQDGDRDLYEVRGGQCRIVLYHHTEGNNFILLHGFMKKRPRERKEIEIARSRFHEYQSRR